MCMSEYDGVVEKIELSLAKNSHWELCGANQAPQQCWSIGGGNPELHFPLHFTDI